MSIQNYEYSEIHDIESNGKPILAYDDISLISDLEVDIDVIIGTAKLTVSDLYELKDGSVIRLAEDVETLVDIRVNGNVIARGLLSIVDDNYAVKITESVNDK